MTSLWRKRKTSDKVATDVHHNEQKPDHLVNILTNLSIKSEQKQDTLSDPLDLLHEENVRLGLYEGVYDLSIKSDDLSIKSEKAMREVQRLGQEIEQEPVSWYRDENGIRIYYETKVWDDCTPLYTTPQQPTWVGLTEDERYKLWLTTPSETEDRFAFAKAIEQALKERNT